MTATPNRLNTGTASVYLDLKNQKKGTTDPH